VPPCPSGQAARGSEEAAFSREATNSWFSGVLMHGSYFPGVGMPHLKVLPD
jgi:hypothetical protein